MHGKRCLLQLQIKDIAIFRKQGAASRRRCPCTAACMHACVHAGWIKAMPAAQNSLLARYQKWMARKEATMGLATTARDEIGFLAILSVSGVLYVPIPCAI